ncbi:MAG: leucine-rich repeat protein [Bacteroidales bacterium]|nr:leucine-rich repeat protein [Bacteroidales bacterium]
MKKLLLLLLLCTVGVTNLVAQSFNEGILNYTVNADGTTVTVKLKSGATSSGSLSIPSTVTYNDNTYTVTAIANQAFYHCSGFTGTLSLPNTLVTIGNYAFGSCTNFVGSLTIPNSVTTIGNSAFSYCSSFTGSLTIGSSVSSIGNEAFKNCTSLTSIMVYPESVPTMGTDVFLNVPTDIPVTVPSVSLADYQSASGWSDFTNMHCMETLTVYDGTTTKNTVPAYIFYFDDFTRSQFIIPADDLVEMINQPITSMTFYTDSDYVPYTTVSPADVYLMEVNYTSISAYESKSSATIVYSGFFDIVSTDNGGKMTINFSTPFTYQGGNLLVGIENTVDVGYKNIYFYGQTVNGASISGYNSTSLDNVQPTQRNFIPKTTFGFTPACDPKSLPYAYGFEDPGELDCWTMLNCDDGSTISHSSAYEGQYGFGFHWNYNPPQYLISPKFDGTTGMNVSFNYKNASNDWPETFQVGYSTTTKSPNAFIWGEEVTANDITWHLYEASFPIGTKYVAVKLNSYDAYYLYLDNFNFEPILSNIFLTDGYWNDGSNWNIGEVPQEGSDVIIQADAVIPEGYTAYAWNVVLDGGSITVEDGGQLWHRTDNLVVTMKKNIVGYGNANNQDHYYLLASPFIEDIPVPTAMTSPGCDLYKFNENYPNAEWRNSNQDPIDELEQLEGYLFASPNDQELSLTGSTMMSGSYNLPNVPYYENPNNTFNGWRLLGNFLTCDVYIYRQDDDGEYIPMELMVYNEEGEKVTLSAGPISPMSAFFVKLTETTTIKYYYYPISSARPAGALKGKFTVNSNGDQVRFSQGNLQYIGSVSTPYWKFADKQWETLGNNGQGSTSQYVDRDLFGWGTSGYNHGAVCYQPWSTSQTNSDYYAYNSQYRDLNYSTGQADWGYNAIRNGGNQENSGWRTLTNDEWTYILNGRSTESGIRFVLGNVNGVDGVILLPDNWSTSTYTLTGANNDYGNFLNNIISATDWTTILEANGAVFLPKTVGREGTSITTYCNYWSSTHSSAGFSYCIYIAGYIGYSNTVNNRSTGNVVRLVNPVNN